MNKDNLLNTFLNQTYSTFEIKRRLLILKNFIYQKYFKSEFKKEDFETTDVRWLENLGEEFFKNFTETNVTITLSELEKELKNLNVLTIYVPFEMPEAEAHNLGTWLKQNISQNLIFELRINPDLIGGAAISFKGVYKDYSLMNTISQNRTQVLESFKTSLST